MIDLQLNQELKQKYSPEGSGLRNMQLKLLDMLLWIHNICTENNINYWISSGTCLGAVRHGGFIPWDDDIDIEMTASDYKRFEEIILSIQNCPYKLQSHSTDPEYYLSFSKIRDERYPIMEITNHDKYYNYKGIFIDIFIVIPKIPYWKARIGEIWGRRCVKYSNNTNKIIRQIIRYGLYPIGQYIIKPLLLQIGKADSTEYSMQFGMPIWKQRTVNDIQLPRPILFENHEVMGPSNPEKYLRNIYGNYMDIPKIDEIKRHFNTSNNNQLDK